MPPELSILNRGREKSLFPTTNRLAIHYFPDTLHYRDADLQTWLPQLTALGVSWLILETDAARAIPETFISALVAAQIRPILRFNLSPEQLPNDGDLRLLLDVYGRWGVKQAIFFDRPNDRSAWSASAWAQPDLVERFLDRFIPLAEAALAAGITPIFPPLQPGGSYWDTVFLRSALQSLVRRKHEQLAVSMGLAAYGWLHSHSLNWGAGGPVAWPRTRPYSTPEDSENQLGFRVFDWYQEIARAVLHTSLPMYLLQAGVNQQATLPGQLNTTIEDTLSIARLLAGETLNDESQGRTHPIPAEVVCGAFWLLAAEDGPHAAAAWFTADGRPNAQVEVLSAWRARTKVNQLGANRIKHYLLLPAYEWGIDEVHLEAIRPFLRKYRPAIGFSTEEAVLADCVTVIGDESAYPEEALNRLRQTGCRVERIQGDGITIASLLSER